MGVPAGLQCIKNLECSGSGCCGGVNSIPGLVQWVKEFSIAAAAAQIQSLAQELPYAIGVAIKKKGMGSSRRGAVVNESD